MLLGMKSPVGVHTRRPVRYSRSMASYGHKGFQGHRHRRPCLYQAGSYKLEER